MPEIPKEAVEAILQRRHGKGGRPEGDVLTEERFGIVADLTHAAPVIRAQERQRVREALVGDHALKVGVAHLDRPYRRSRQTKEEFTREALEAVAASILGD